jgi:acyl-CoA synthetase (AMP-forming)/AMP-acid ligase II
MSSPEPVIRCTWFATFHDRTQAARRVASDDLARIEAAMAAVPGLVRGLVHLPDQARDPYLDDGAAPQLVLQLGFADQAALESALAADGSLAMLARPGALPSLEGIVPVQQAMATRLIAVPGKTLAGRAACRASYLVSYPGPAEDVAAWTGHYIGSHGPLMTRFPGIREVEIHTALDWRGGIDWPCETHMLRNRVVFDDAAALGRSLESPVRHEMREDFNRFPPFAGGNTHFAMQSIESVRAGLTSQTVYGALQRAAARHPVREFLHVPASACAGWHEGPWTVAYRDALAAVDALAARYRRSGYGIGHRVALLLENRPQCLLHYLALNAVGASVVPLNPDYRSAELSYVLEHSEATLAVVLPQRVAALEALALPGLRVMAAPEGCPDREQAVALAEGFVPPPAQAPVAAGGSTSPGRGTECALLYTSGTTGKPKGCIIDNDYCLRMGEHYLTEGGLCRVDEGSERLITPLPLFHMNALVASAMAMIMSGGCVVQLDRFHPRSWWADVAASGATILHYLGVMPAILMGLPPGPQDRAHRVRFGFGANANPADHAAFEARFGLPLIEAWSMTETASGGAITASREPRHVGTRCIGWPRPVIEWQLVDEAGRRVPRGEPGELWVRRAGPDPRAGFCRGYLKDPAATDKVWRDGWFHTGDVVREGEDGQIHFVDRGRNIIRRAGENIAALEVEAVLAGHAAVAQVAIIGVSDALRDEEVMACVVPPPGTTSDREAALSVQRWCLERLAYFKAPGWVAFVETLPTTATNKVQKGQLAALGESLKTATTTHDLRDTKRRTRD